MFVGLAAPVAAQSDLTARGRDSSARTILGAPEAKACADAAAQGRTDDSALAHCDAALAHEPLGRDGELITRQNKGAILLRRRDGEGALAEFDAVLARRPNNGDLMLNRAAALILLRRHGPAIAAITEALGQGVRQPHKAYFNRGQAREQLGDLKGALEDYTTALEIEPDWGPAEEELRRFVIVRRDAVAEELQQAALDAPPPEAP